MTHLFHTESIRTKLNMKDETKGMLLGLFAVIGFGLTLPATKLVVPYLDPIFIGLGRAIFASLFAVIFLFVLRQPFPRKKQIYKLLVVALSVVVGFPVLSSWAMLYVPASHGGVVLGILPLATAITGVLIGNERPNIYFWLVSSIGAGLVILYSLIQGSGGIHIADVTLLGAVISAAIGYAVGANLAKELGGWQVICWALVFALPFIIIPAIYYAPKSLSNIPVAGYIGFLYLALISQLFAFFVWYKGLALGGIARVSQIQLLQPFITLLVSALFLSEIIEIETIVFVLLVVSSVWLGKKIPINQKA